MYRSTTPELIFRIKNEDFDMSKIEICHVTLENYMGTYQKIYEQPDIDAENKTVSVVMTQAETLKFDEGKVRIQLKIKLDNGAVICSKIMEREMREILEEAEL